MISKGNDVRKRESIDRAEFLKGGNMNYDGGNPGGTGQGNPGAFWAWFTAISILNKWFRKIGNREKSPSEDEEQHPSEENEKYFSEDREI